METMECLLTRRSIRKYVKKEIPGGTMKKILKAGMYAPSARNYQPWYFIVLNQQEILDKVTLFHPYSSMLPKASAGIVVCGDLNIEPTEAYINQDCSAATQNILLAAHDLGLGTVWLGLYPREKRMQGMKDLLKLPHYILPVSLIAIGYPGEEKPVPNRYREDRIRFNSW